MARLWSAVNVPELLAVGEQLQLPQQRSRTDPRRHRVGLSQRDVRVTAGGGQRLGLAPVAVGGERRALELVPRGRGLGPRLR